MCVATKGMNGLRMLLHSCSTMVLKIAITSKAVCRVGLPSSDMKAQMCDATMLNFYSIA